MARTGIRSASIPLRSGGTPLADLADELQPAEAALVILFVGQAVDLETLAAEMRAAFPATPLIACTTAGELGAHGYASDTVTGVAFSGEHFSVELACFRNLQAAGVAPWSEQARQAAQRLAARQTATRQVFGFLMIDGLSRREEPLAAALHAALGRIPLVGGSAGDGLRFEQTHVYFDGEFHRDAAVLALIDTDLPVKIFKTQHFERSGQRMVVTGADAASRTISEINGLPAAAEYARMIGIATDDLTPQVFAAHPVVVRVGNTDYVRAIQKLNTDGSLSFFCAIDEGIVLTVARGVDFIQNLESAFAAVRDEIGPPQLTLACDCILRCLEAQQNDLVDQLAAVFAANGVIGFNSYGEQYCGMHVNQTFTGVAIGASSAGQTR